MSLHFVKSVDYILRNAASVSKSNPLRPKVARDPICSNGYLGEDALEKLAGTMTPPPLGLKHEWDQLLLRALQKEAVLVPLLTSRYHRGRSRVV